MASPIVGPAGNHEYLAWMTKTGITNKIINNQYIEDLVRDTL